MKKNSYEPFTVDDVVADIKQELVKPTPELDAVARQLDDLRQFQLNLREAPVVGSLLILKELFFSLVRSTFARQFHFNDRVINLITILDNKINQHQSENKQEIAQLYHTWQQFDSRSLEIGTEPNDTKYVTFSDMDNARQTDKIISRVSTWLTLTERMLLYSLIAGLKPGSCLEIGTMQGGTATIICTALDHIGFGQLITIDPAPQVAPSVWEQIVHRTKGLEQSLPGAVGEARRVATMPFDFVLYKGGSLPGQDIETILPHLSDRAYILIYNSYQPEVRQTIEMTLYKYQADLIDCGTLASETRVQMGDGEESLTLWGGMRLLRFARN